MIIPRYHIGPSRIAGAGKGLFLDEPVARGRIVIAPDAIPRVHSFEEIERMPEAATLLPATVRWFENAYTVTPEWPDECYVNHAFDPTGLWHLGFIFAATDLPAGVEITVDYRHLLAPGQEEDFRDSTSGEPIVGFSWEESLRASTRALAALVGWMMVEIPVIDTERLRLTAFAERHFEAYASMLGDPTSTRFVGDGEPLDRMNAWRSMAMLLGHWQLRGYGMWAMELRETGEFIGRVGLHQPEGWPALEIGWMLRADQRRHGYATEGARVALEFAFRTLGAEKLVSLIRADNAAAERVARRLGGRQATTIDFLGGATLVYVYHPPEADA